MACLDSTVFLDLRGRSGKRRQAAVEAAIRELAARGESFVTTRINVAELQVGVELADNPVREAALVKDALRDMEILELDESAALAFARIRAFLQQRGRLVGDLDMLIAGIAIANQEPLVTANGRHFSGIPGLTVVAYGP